jgi:colicin import membrane protein
MQPQVPATPSEQPPEPGLPNGWRYVKRTLPDGSEELVEVELTLEDVLHPEEDDEIPMRPLHALDCRYLADVFSTRPLGPPLVYVSFDHLVDWGVPDQRNTSPDVGAFVGLREMPNLHFGPLDLKALGGRCLLVVEVVSPERRVNDVVHKVREYHQAGVPLYVIVDQERPGGPRWLVGHRRTANGYEVEHPSSRGLFLPPLGLYLNLSDQGPVLCTDARTGRDLGDYARVAHDLASADQRILEQTQALEDAVLDARQQAKALEDVQRLAREEAERQQREHAKAQQAAADEIKELKAALSRLQRPTPP